MQYNHLLEKMCTHMNAFVHIIYIIQIILLLDVRKINVIVRFVCLIIKEKIFQCLSLLGHFHFVYFRVFLIHSLYITHLKWDWTCLNCHTEAYRRSCLLKDTSPNWTVIIVHMYSVHTAHHHYMYINNYLLHLCGLLWQLGSAAWIVKKWS